MAVRTVTVELNLHATSFLADGRAVVRVNDEMAHSFTRLGTRAQASSTALNDASRNVAQLSRRANTAERHIRDLRVEIDRLTVSALAARGPVNIINGSGGGGGGGGRGGGIFSAVGDAFGALPGPAKVAIVTAAAIIAAIFVTALGAMIAGALTLVVSGAILAAMVALAAMASGAVRGAFSSLGKGILADLKGFALAFEAPLIQSAHDFGDAWLKIGPQVNELFGMMAKSIRPLVAGIIGLVEKAMPGLKAGLANAQPVIAEFARDLPFVGLAFGYMFRQMSAGGGVVKGLRLLMMLLVGTMKFIGDTLHGLSVAFDFFSRNGEAMLRIFSAIPGIGMGFGNLADKLHMLNQAGQDLPVQPMDDFAIGMERSARAAEALDSATGDLNTRMDKLAQSMLGLSNANLDFNQSLLDLRQSFKDNGKTLDDHTAKGIANQRMVLASVTAAQQARDAFIEQNTATLGVVEATRQANAAYSSAIAQINAVLRAAGLTAAQINQLTGRWMAWVNTPMNANKTTTVTTIFKTVGSATITRDNGQSFGKLPGGTHVFNRQGGLYMADQGLLNLDGRAQMFAAGGTPTFGFAERGTGGEAFIARNADHGRSLAIANQAARWHGGRVVTGNSGGVLEVRLVSSGRGGGDTGIGSLFKRWLDNELHTGGYKLQVVNARVKPV